MPPTEEKDVQAQLAVMNTQIQTLTKTVDGLVEEVKALTALANQGKGSLRTLLIVGGLWTGLVAFLSFVAGNLTWKITQPMEKLMTTKAEHIDTLARTLYGEAKPHDIQDATAIACVVMNRVALPNWPDDVESVCIQPYHFSCWNTSDPNRARIFKANGAWFDKCVQIAMKAVDHQLVDPTNASTHYHTPAVKPAWSRGKKPVYFTSGHMFFNDIDTKPPASAKDALNQIKPIGKTDTMVATKIGGVASVGIGAVSQAIETLEPAMPLATTLAQAAPWAIVAVLAMALLYIAWSRYQARKEGKI